MNKKQLFENVSGNTFKMASPQAMGMMQESPVAGKVRITLCRSPETNEWLVRVYINGKYSEDATYYTDDKQDAIDTGKSMLQTYQQQGFEVEKNKSSIVPEAKTNEISTEELAEIWREDQAGEYVQINPDGSVVYVAHGKAMEQIAPKNTGRYMFKLIGSWMKAKNYYPNIWQVNDHGNIELYSSSGKPLGGLV